MVGRLPQKRSWPPGRVDGSRGTRFAKRCFRPTGCDIVTPLDPAASSFPKPYRRPLGAPSSRALGPGLGVVLLVFGAGCNTVAPGENFSVPEESFNEDFFFCHVEPELLFGRKCGSGDPAAGDRSGGCHFNPGAVSGMALIDHAPVDCGGGDRPLSRAALGAGSSARGNLQAASLVMSRDYLTAPIYLRPTGANHPRAVFSKDDRVVDLIRTWAQRP